MGKKAIARLLYNIFAARTDVYAVAQYDGNNVSYRPVRKDFTEEQVMDHLEGRICLGAYHLSLENTVRWFGWDVDSNNLGKAQKAASDLILRLGNVPHAVEFSGSKGYHILIFLSRPIAAEEAKTIAEAIRSEAGLAISGETHCEVFPKQATLNPNNPMGSLLKMPLGNHPRSGEWSRFVDPTNGWESGPVVPPEEVLNNLVDPDLLKTLNHARSPEEQMADLLMPQWQFGNRHELSLALAGFFANLGWNVEHVKQVITDMCERALDPEIANRLEAVEDTFQRIAERKVVAGYSVLSEMLPGAVLKRLTELATSVHVESGVRKLDEIRLSKGSQHLKVRLAENTLWADTSSCGLWVKSEMGLHYLDDETHRLFKVEGRPSEDNKFLQVLHRKYGLNISESFGHQVYSGLILKAYDQAHTVKVHRRSHWDGQRLYVCLGGPEVYVLDGKTITQTYNGEGGHIFESVEGEVAVLPLDQRWEEGISWRFLTDNLSLAESKDAPASPPQQKELLKAWILNTFFPELAPTKPLLLCLGAPGSGKTTAMRRVLKLLDGWDSDVLEINRDKQDSLRSTFTNHHIIVLDNLEKSGTSWLVDSLNRIATGTHIELRQLYTTNSVIRFRPQCFVAMTAVTVPFSDETVYDRMLPVEFQRLKTPKPEHLIQAELLNNYVDVWLDFLGMLNSIVQALHSFKPTSAKTRLADFAAFCQVGHKAGVLSDDIVGGIKALTQQQQFALSFNSPFVEVLEMWTASNPNDAAQYHSASELLNILTPIAKNLKDNRWQWTTAQGLSRHIAVLEDRLVQMYGCDIKEEFNSKQGKTVRKYAFGGRE
jgi:hypothetical protein